MVHVMIKGLQKTTLVDYPGKVACTIFLGGCNFKCGYCQNAGLVLTPNKFSSIKEKTLFSFLKKRRELLDGVCITGGEPTIYKEKLLGLMQKIKKLGFKVKLDTNGSNPKLLKKIIEKKLVDYIAMDVKASLENYEKIIYVKTNLENIRKSIELIKNSGIKHEFRTTIVPDTINEKEIKGIGKLIKGANQFFLQQFKAVPTTIDKKYSEMPGLNAGKLKYFEKIMKKYVKKTGIRNI